MFVYKSMWKRSVWKNKPTQQSEQASLFDLGQSISTFLENHIENVLALDSFFCTFFDHPLQLSSEVVFDYNSLLQRLSVENKFIQLDTTHG
ncbi:unnamed protein product [Trifolium pratense]|uniref:Uncharacterized protein n=1 Tax=Trifolium pratense TaxID=57577 RepID=A0ACB0J758_TRIPR|nr:unnamed protein product [Trifolium pratense]